MTGKLIDKGDVVLRRVAAWVLVIAAAMAMPAGGPVTATGAQDGRQSPEQEGAPAATFRSKVELVTVSATVRDRRGRIVRNLTKGDFQVFESGVRRSILDVYAGDSPISLGVVLDISGSMAVGGNMDRARHAVGLAVDSLRSGVDEAALFTFDSSLREVVSFTREIERVRSVSLEGRPWGVTSLFDAIAAAAEVSAARANRRRALLVITDGVDNASALAPARVSAIASAINVPVYLLTVLHPLDHSREGGQTVRVDGRSVDVATLADLARWTGGTIGVSSTQAHSVDVVRELFTELRHQYLITFEPGVQGGWQSLEVRTRDRDLTVQARGGYMAGPS